MSQLIIKFINGEKLELSLCDTIEGYNEICKNYDDIPGIESYFDTEIGKLPKNNVKSIILGCLWGCKIFTVNNGNTFYKTSLIFSVEFVD